MNCKISAILAADIAGYSKLVAEDEEQTLRRLAVYRETFGDFVSRAGGRIFNTAGDAILAEFPSAVEAVRCAIDVQESLRTRNLAYPTSRHMNFRIGITLGDVVERDGDLFGEGVNIAARLEGIAEPGGICISRSIHEQVINKLSVRFDDIGDQNVKNIPNAIRAYVLKPAGPGRRSAARKTTLVLAAAASVASVAAVAAVLSYNWSSPGNQATAAKSESMAGSTPPQSPMIPSQMPGASPETVTTPAAPPAPAVPTDQSPRDPLPAQQVVPSQPATGPSPAPATVPGEAAVSQKPAANCREGSRARALAAQLQIPLPDTFDDVTPNPSVPDKVARYHGAWGGERRWNFTGRHIMLIVTAVDQSGSVRGIFAQGPPSATSTNQNPASYIFFEGSITQNGLQFVGWKVYKYVFRLTANDSLSGQVNGPPNFQTHIASITIERIKR